MSPEPASAEAMGAATLLLLTVAQIWKVCEHRIETMTRLCDALRHELKPLPLEVLYACFL